VPLLRRAYQQWAELERDASQRLFYRVGLLEVGPADGVVVPGVLRSAREHGLNVQAFSASEAMQLFPGFRVPEQFAAVFEADAGYLLVEQAVQVHAALATAAGAELAIGEEARSWRGLRNGVEVVTDRGRYEAGHLVVTAGAWAGQWLGELGVPLQVVRKHLYWYPTTSPRYRAASASPTYLFELPEGVFYGFPEIGEEPALKVGRHSGVSETVTDPLAERREENPHDRRLVDDFVARCLPGARPAPIRHTTCFYTMSPDEHFIVDRHPDWPLVAFAAGLSGHGYKFAPVLGEILASLVCDGATVLPCSFLGLARFGKAHPRPTGL
jgi:monomeric sarcosine oxidase